MSICIVYCTVLCVCAHYNSIMNNTISTCTCTGVVLIIYVSICIVYYTVLCVCVHYNSIMNNTIFTCTCVVLIIYVFLVIWIDGCCQW